MKSFAAAAVCPCIHVYCKSSCDQVLRPCTHLAIFTTTITWHSSLSKADDAFLFRGRRLCVCHQFSAWTLVARVNMILVQWHKICTFTMDSLSMHCILLTYIKRQSNTVWEVKVTCYIDKFLFYGSTVYTQVYKIFQKTNNFIKMKLGLKWFA